MPLTTLEIIETQVKEYSISTDTNKLDLDRTLAFLHDTFWAKTLTMDRLHRAIANSLCAGVYHQGKQVGFARLVTDYATFAYLTDVYVLEEHRRRGLALAMAELLVQHPAVAEVDHFALLTLDAQALYQKVGFSLSPHPSLWMELLKR